MSGKAFVSFEIDATSAPTLPRERPSQSCAPEEIALKSFFLGPQSENAPWLQDVLQEVLKNYFRWRQEIYPDDGPAISPQDQETKAFQERRAHFRNEVQDLLHRFEAEVPKFSPRYIGHMFSETSMPAIVGHLITLLHNPNNISGESSRVGVTLEDEAIEALRKMVGLSRGYGHFTSGGTLANFEGLVRARHRLERFLIVGAEARRRRLRTLSLMEAAHLGWDQHDQLLSKLQDLKVEPQKEENPFDEARRLEEIFAGPYRGPLLLVPEHKHYSWVKGVDLLGLGKGAFQPVALNRDGVMDLLDLRRRIEEARRQQRPILMVVSVAGTTELGAFDPVHRVQDLLDEYARQGLHIWHHIDAAYGGFFAANACGDDRECILGLRACQAIRSLHRANSITLDPHKLGYVPYASGAFLTARRREYFSGSVDAPYLAMDENRDRGPQTIEGSRSAAGAVATWLTARTIGLDQKGYGAILRRTLQARRRLEVALRKLDLPVRLCPAHSNLLTFCVASAGEPLSVTNARTMKIYDHFSPEENNDFFVSRTTLRFSSYGAFLDRFVDSWQARRDAPELTLLRLSVMNPFLDSRETAVDYPAAFAEALQELLQEELPPS